MKEANEFFNNLTESIKSSINVSLLARVERFDSVKMVADIKPLKRDLPLIQNVPIAMVKVEDYYLRSNLAIGEVVVVLFSDYSLEGFIDDGKEREVVVNDNHSLNNAVIVGVIAPFNTHPNSIKDLKELVGEPM